MPDLPENPRVAGHLARAIRTGAPYLVRRVHLGDDRDPRWAVIVDGVLDSPTFGSRDAAWAYIATLRGYRP